MADSSLKAPLSSNQQQIRRELLPKEWSAALVLDYLDKSEYGGELTSRVLSIGNATYNLQVTMEGVVLQLMNVTNELDFHVAQSSAHGASGDLVGSNNYASAVKGGAVLLADAVADAIDSTVTVAAPNASAAPVAYSQVQVQELVTLANELKSDLTQAVSDLNAAIAVINDMLASERTAKQRAL